MTTTQIESYQVPTHGDVFIDVGANIGMWTKALYPHWNKIYFIEPSEAATQQAQAEIADPDNKIVYMRNLCSSKAGERYNIYSPSQETGNFSIYGAELYEQRIGIQQREDNIETITVDSLIDQIPAQSKVLLKVDTEGHDLDVLLGASELIKKFLPIVACEVHFHMHFEESKLQRVLDLFTYLGYFRQDNKSPWYHGSNLVDGIHTGDQMRDLHFQILWTPKLRV